MSKSRFPNSIRKHIRKEKARIRREVFDIDKQKEEIDKLYKKFIEKLPQVSITTQKKNKVD